MSYGFNLRMASNWSLSAQLCTGAPLEEVLVMIVAVELGSHLAGEAVHDDPLGQVGPGRLGTLELPGPVILEAA